MNKKTYYVKLDCPKCPKIHSMMLMANNVVKCQSCLKKFDIEDDIIVSKRESNGKSDNIKQ